MVCIDPRSAKLPEHFHSACELANDLIARKARQLAKQYRWDDRGPDDIESDLWLATWRSWDKNPDHPNPEALTTVVVQRASISMVRRRYSQRRDPSRRGPDLDPDTLAGPDRVADLDLRLDVEELSRRLSPAAKSLVDELREDNMAGISRRTGLPRSTLYKVLHEARTTLKVTRPTHPGQ